MPGLEVRRFGPFVKGVSEAANEALDLTGAMRFARNAVMDGVGRLKVRPGTQVAMTLKDDAGTPANVTSIIALVEFGDGALAVAHSTVTSKFYLYRLTSGLDAWYNAASVLQSNTNPQPVAVLWTGIATPAKVLIAEGLGEAYIAHNQAGSSFKSWKYTVGSGLVALQADLDGTGLKDTFFRGFVSFQQHLWGWGYGSQAAGDNDRPELLRFGFPNFATSGGGYFAAADSITVGHRVRTASERVVGAGVAGQVLYVGTNFSLWPITGFGRNSWDKSRPLDDSYGFAGPLAWASANGLLHYWSHRGPLRVGGLERPEPTWDPVTVAASSLVSPADIVGTFDPDRDQVIFLYRSPTSGRVSALAAIDTRREAWLGPDGDIGLGVGCAGLVHPTSVSGPTAAPTLGTTTNIGASVATGNLTAGDTSAGTTTIWEYKRASDSVYTVAAETPATQLAYQFTGLTRNTDYQWRAKHLKNGQSSAYVGPIAFTTLNQLAPPVITSLVVTPLGFGNLWRFDLAWANSGEADVQTEFYFDGSLKQTLAHGVASVSYTATNGTGHTLKIRHVLSGVTPSTYSTAVT